MKNYAVNTFSMNNDGDKACRSNKRRNLVSKYKDREIEFLFKKNYSISKKSQNDPVSKNFTKSRKFVRMEISHILKNLPPLIH